ncbi:hypothetical protein TMatcc_005769 [Talaromyces marneffei ATCC 18224]
MDPIPVPMRASIPYISPLVVFPSHRCVKPIPLYATHHKENPTQITSKYRLKRDMYSPDRTEAVDWKKAKGNEHIAD